MKALTKKQKTELAMKGVEARKAKKEINCMEMERRLSKCLAINATLQTPT